jgi:hypothetical protein
MTTIKAVRLSAPMADALQRIKGNGHTARISSRTVDALRRHGLIVDNDRCGADLTDLGRISLANA